MSAGTSKKGFLEGIVLFILEQGIGKARRAILARQVAAHGGGVATCASQKDITHIAVGDAVKWPRLPILLKLDSIPESVDVVHADWLSASIVAGQPLDPSPYLLRHQSPGKRQSDKDNEMSKKAKQDDDDDHVTTKVCVLYCSRATKLGHAHLI